MVFLEQPTDLASKFRNRHNKYKAQDGRHSSRSDSAAGLFQAHRQY